jgi:hypothetical protein
MPTATTPLSGSILWRDQQKTVDLLDAAAKELADLAQHGQLNDEVTSRLAQMVRICLRSPDMMRDLWEWAKAEEVAGRLGDWQRAGEDFRYQFGNWLQLLAVIQQVARGCEAAGHPVGGADELEGAADEMRGILREVNETWPPQEAGATRPLSYEELRTLADRFPPPVQWYEEEDDLF